MKYFIITMDTEGDNLWNWKNGDQITTENVLYLQRFQNLANRYGFKPVWLTNYEMIMDDRYVDFINNVETNKLGEIGMHLHAWNTPPNFDLPIENVGQPYLFEYPVSVMEAKIATMTEIIEKKTKVKPVTHRAGRWATNNDYFSLLTKYGYTVDCSVTPHVNWEKCPGQSNGAKGTNYFLNSEIPYYINEKMIEVPLTIRKSHHLFTPNVISLRKISGEIYRGVTGETLWCRPNGVNLQKMLYLLKLVEKSNDDYVMLMLHSSELMAGGSPTFQNSNAIEKLYVDLEVLFSEASKTFRGITLRDFACVYRKAHPIQNRII